MGLLPCSESPLFSIHYPLDLILWNVTFLIFINKILNENCIDLRSNKSSCFCHRTTLKQGLITTIWIWNHVILSCVFTKSNCNIPFLLQRISKLFSANLLLPNIKVLLRCDMQRCHQKWYIWDVQKNKIDILGNHFWLWNYKYRRIWIQITRKFLVNQVS